MAHRTGLPCVARAVPNARRSECATAMLRRGQTFRCAGKEFQRSEAWHARAGAFVRRHGNCKFDTVSAPALTTMEPENGSWARKWRARTECGRRGRNSPAVVALGGYACRHEASACAGCRCTARRHCNDTPGLGPAHGALARVALSQGAGMRLRSVAGGALAHWPGLKHCSVRRVSRARWRAPRHPSRPTNMRRLTTA